MYNAAVPVAISAVRSVLPGVTAKSLTADDHLFCTFPERYSTVLHLAGRSDWTMRRARWSSSPGDVGVKVPGELYVERSRRGRAALQVIIFDDAVVADVRAALSRTRRAPHYTALTPDDPRARPLLALHRRLRDADTPTAELEQLVCEALPAFVALTCADAEPTGRASRSVARARALLDERLHETVGLDELAAHARLDKYRLCRAFRDELGLPPHAYVTHRRVSLAQTMLARGLPQAEVAARVGLYDQSQLHRHFKRIVGVTPGAYARAVR